MIITTEERQTYCNTPEPGDLHITTKFALLPVRVNGKRIWLKKFQMLYEWNERERDVVIGKELVGTGWFYNWDLISVKVL